MGGAIHLKGRMLHHHGVKNGHFQHKHKHGHSKTHKHNHSSLVHLERKHNKTHSVKQNYLATKNEYPN
jgi:hypothetical protein